MPAAEVEFDDGDEALGGVIDLGNGQQHLRMAHEACKRESAGWRDKGSGGKQATNLVILSNMLRGSRMKVGRTTLLRSAPGRSWEMMCIRTTLAFSARQHSTQTRGLEEGEGGSYHCPGRARRRECHPRLRHRTRNGCLRAGEVSVLVSRLASPGLRVGSGREARTSRRAGSMAAAQSYFAVHGGGCFGFATGCNEASCVGLL